jgi:ABC-type nitrate/sulfonate/bicarbonate transport system substrate-binding protein
MKIFRSSTHQAGRRWPALLAVVAGVFAMLVTACGSDDGESASRVSEASNLSCGDVDLSKPPATPTTIRIGRGEASEEPLWLLEAKPDLAEYRNSWYRIEFTKFPSTQTRYVAAQANEIDALTTAALDLSLAHANGALDAVNVVAIMRNDTKDSNDVLVASAQSGIDTVADLEGKTIGIIGLRTVPDFGAKAAVAKAGADPKTGAKYVVMPFPAQPDALKSGQIDAAVIVSPFREIALRDGARPIATVFELAGFPFDVLNVAFQRSFIEKNLGAVCAFRADFARTAKFWANDEQAARQALLDAGGFILAPPDVYLQADRSTPIPDGRVDPEGGARFVQRAIELGILPQNVEEVDVRNDLYMKGISQGVE